MHYLTLLHGQPATTPPPEGVMEAIIDLGRQATEAGVLVTQSGLQPSSQGARLTLDGSPITVADGPFAETKELLSYAVYACASLDEAVEWSRRFLAVHEELWPGWSGEITVLPVFAPPPPPAAP